MSSEHITRKVCFIKPPRACDLRCRAFYSEDIEGVAHPGCKIIDALADIAAALNVISDEGLGIKGWPY